tara:strand:+ start:1841 stop:4396 length:2556 start_codon:yes stop_codon:yes gene_type:complete
VHCQPKEYHQYICNNGCWNGGEEIEETSSVYGPWITGVSTPYGTRVTHNGNSYTSDAGVTGTNPPVHTGSPWSVLDGGVGSVNWTYLMPGHPGLIIDMVECKRFNDAVILYGDQPAYHQVTGNQIANSSRYVPTGYYQENIYSTLTGLLTSCDTRFWNAKLQVFEPKKMFMIWKQSGANSFSPPAGMISTSNGSGTFNMLGTQVQFIYINHEDSAPWGSTIAKNRQCWLHSLTQGDIFKIIVGDPLTSSNTYTYEVNYWNGQAGYDAISVTCISQTASNASFFPGTDLCIAMPVRCESIGIALDYPYPNNQVAPCSLPATGVFIDTPTFATATGIWADICLDTPATDGWWNDGIIRRDWDVPTMTLGPAIPCGSNGHQMRYNVNSYYTAQNTHISCTSAFVTVYQDVNVTGSTTFSWIHPIYTDATLSTHATLGYYSDGSVWQLYKTAWIGSLAPCLKSYPNKVRYQPPSKKKFICNAPQITIYQTINVLTLGNNTYKPYTNSTLTNLHTAKWFICCVAGVNSYTAYYWTGSQWSGTHNCPAKVPNDNGHSIQFAVGVVNFRQGIDIHQTEAKNWNDTEVGVAYWKKAVCDEPIKSQYVWQKKEDTNLTYDERTPGSEEFVNTEEFSFLKPIYTDEKMETVVPGRDGGFMIGYNGQFSAFTGDSWNPTTPINLCKVSASEAFSMGCVLEGTLIDLADGTTMLVEELLAYTQVNTKESNKILKSDNDIELENFSFSGDITWTDGVERVIIAKQYKVDCIYEIEFNEVAERLSTSWDHWNIIKRNTNDWLYQRTCQLEVGDSLPHRTGNNVTIKNITIEYGLFNTYRIDVTDSNLYIANGILTHNAADKERDR